VRDVSVRDAGGAHWSRLDAGFFPVDGDGSVGLIARPQTVTIGRKGSPNCVPVGGHSQSEESVTISSISPSPVFDRPIDKCSIAPNTYSSK
jgi:hypothetical protein